MRCCTDVSVSSVTYDPAWGVNQLMNLQMVSAMCPLCQLVYVGADAAFFSDLYTAVQFAQTVADVVLMTWGGPEGPNSPADDLSYFQTTKKAFVAAVGALNYGGIWYPASSAYVTAVGGTRLTLNPDFSRYLYGSCDSL